jgi:outer membrane lipoprotein-sorting protein
MNTMTLRISLALAALLAAAAMAASPTPPASGQLPAARDVVSRLEARFAEVTDYECVMDSEEYRAKKSDIGSYRIWFKKPELFRLKVEKGHHVGSEIALTKQGNVRARPGGFLKKLVSKAMSRDDKQLRSLRGGYPWDANFGSLIAALKRHVQQAERAEVRAAAGPPQVLDLQVEYRDPSLGPVREVWSVDATSWLITGSDTYEGPTLAERVRFRGYRDNLGIPESFFSL